MDLTYHFRDIKELVGSTNHLLGQISSRLSTAGGPLNDGYGIDLRAKQTVEALAVLVGQAKLLTSALSGIFLLLAVHIIHHW